MMSQAMNFSFREEDLPPKVRKEIGDVAQRLDYYNFVASTRDRAKATARSRIYILIALAIIGAITIVIFIGLIFFGLAFWAYWSYKKNKAAAKSKETEAYSCWKDITNRVKKISDDAYNELSALHEARVRPTLKHVMVDFASIIQAARGRGIVLDTIECPYCRGAVNIPPSGEYFQCKYCGKTIHATNVFDKLKDILSPT
jgi:hypothetical protein